MLLFGVVTYAAGRLGDEPVRSQGHVHRISQHSGWSPPELYEIWQGKPLSTCRVCGGRPRSLLCGHRRAGRKGTGAARLGHATISASPDEPLTFGAWCDREYGFEYDAVRAEKGWPGIRCCRMNRLSGCIIRTIFPGAYRLLPRQYTGLALLRAVYQQFIDDPAASSLSPVRQRNYAEFPSIAKPGHALMPIV
jgi:glucose-6-phosphate isomerase